MALAGVPHRYGNLEALLWLLNPDDDDEGTCAGVDDDPTGTEQQEEEEEEDEGYHLGLRHNNMHQEKSAVILFYRRHEPAGMFLPVHPRRCWVRRRLGLLWKTRYVSVWWFVCFVVLLVCLFV